MSQFQGALFVVPASEMLRVRRDLSSVEAVRKQFGVNLVLTGSVQRLGSTMRLTTSIVDAATLRQLRSLTIDFSSADPLLLQDGIAQRIADLLELQLRPQAEEVLAAGRTSVAGAHGLYVQGRGYLQRSDKSENIDRAVAAFEGALQLDRRYALAYAGVGEAYWYKYLQTHDAGVAARALDSCRQATALESRLAGPLNCLGTVYQGTGKYEEAVVQFQRAVQLEPTNDDAHRGLGLAQESLHRYPEAEATYQRAIALRPSYWAGYSWLGTFYARRSRYPEAVQMFEKVISLNPDSFLAYRNIGGMLIYEGKYLEAISALQHSVAIRPTAAAYSNLGAAYVYLRNFDKAAASYQEAAGLDPNNIATWGNLGEAYQFMPGRASEAAPALQKALSLTTQKLKVNPRDAQLTANVAYYQALLNDRALALAAITRAMELAPDNPDVLQKAALIHLHFGATDRALGYVTNALRAGLSPSILRDHPGFDKIRGDARFRKLIQE
jgi:serine/threonine-protein kinase